VSAIDLLVALVSSSRLSSAVAPAIEMVERDPLASAGCFRGDLLRGLMEVPGSFWRRAPDLYDRYRRALRAGAALRRRMPQQERMEFWSALDRRTLATHLAATHRPPGSDAARPVTDDDDARGGNRWCS
jgi:CDI immunity proteins